MNRHIRPSFPHHHDQARVGHDQCVWLHGNHRGHIGQIGFDLGVVRQQVGGHVKFLASGMGFLNTDAQLFQLAGQLEQSQPWFKRGPTMFT